LSALNAASAKSIAPLTYMGWLAPINITGWIFKHEDGGGTKLKVEEELQ